MWIYISGWQIVNFGPLSSHIVTKWRSWHSSMRQDWVWCRLSVSVGRRWIHSLAPPVFYGRFAVPSWQERHPLVLFWWSIAGCLCITVFTNLCPGNFTPCSFSSQTSAWCFFIKYWVFSIAVCKNPPLAIVAIFKSRCISDCSSSIWPLCLAIVADMFKTYRKLVAVSNNEIRLLPQQFSLLWPSQGWLIPVSTTFGDAYQ